MKVYIKNSKLYAKIYGKETDRQNIVHRNSEQRIPLENSLPYSRVLRVKRTCSKIENFRLYCSELKQKFIDKEC